MSVEDHLWRAAYEEMLSKPIIYDGFTITARTDDVVRVAVEYDDASGPYMLHSIAQNDTAFIVPNSINGVYIAASRNDTDVKYTTNRRL